MNTEPTDLNPIPTDPTEPPDVIGEPEPEPIVEPEEPPEPKRAKAGRPTKIRCADIQRDPDAAVREAIDRQTVIEYAELVRDGVRLPPIVVFYDGADYWLADGNHRLDAHFAAGAEYISARVIEGTRDDAAWYACAANQTHGRRRSRADNELSVKLALRLAWARGENPSDRAIAKHVGVTHPTVARVRAELAQAASAHGKIYHAPEVRQTADGRTRTVAPRPAPTTEPFPTEPNRSTVQTGHLDPGGTEEPEAYPLDDPPPEMPGEPRELPIAALNLDVGREMHYATVYEGPDAIRSHPEAIEDWAYMIGAGAGENFPPLTVVSDGSTLWLCDGFLRLEAYKRAGRDTIRAVVFGGDYNAAVKRCTSSNTEPRGDRLSRADQRYAARKLIALKHKDLGTDRDIALCLGVVERVVAEERAKMEAEAQAAEDNDKSAEG